MNQEEKHGGFWKVEYNYIISLRNGRSNKLISTDLLMLIEHLLYARCYGTQVCDTWVFHL